MKEIDRAFKLMLTEYPDVLTVQEVAKILGSRPAGLPY